MNAARGQWGYGVAAPRAQARGRAVGLTAAAIGALLLALLYANALFNPFLSDDQPMLADNPTLAQRDGRAAARLWTIDYWSRFDDQGRVTHFGNDRQLYRPVTTLSYWLNARLGASAPAGFRVGNLLLHLAAAAMVGLWAARWLGAWAGAAAMAVVLLHPLGVDVMNRLVGRADVLVLLGMAGFLATQRQAQQRGWTWGRTAAATAWALMALGAKESGLALVLVAMMQAWIGGPAPFVSADGDERVRAAAVGDGARRMESWRGEAALMTVVIGMLALRWHVVGWPAYRSDPTFDLLENPLLRMDAVERVAPALALVAHYLRLMVWPWAVMAAAQPTTAPGWRSPEVWAGAAATLALLAALVVLARRRHVLALAVTAWVAVEVIVGQWIAPIGAWRELRLAYPMLLGLALGAGWIAHEVESRWVERGSAGSRAMTWGAAAAAIALATAWSATIVARNGDYRSEMALVMADLRVDDTSASAHLRAGTLHHEAGRASEALAAKVRAVQLAPGSAQARYELGTLYGMRGDMSASYWMLKQAIEREPRHHLALTNLGVLMLRTGELASARKFLEQAREIEPGSAANLLNVAVLERREGRHAEARAALKAALAIEPRHPDARRMLAEWSVPERTASSGDR